ETDGPEQKNVQRLTGAFREANCNPPLSTFVKVMKWLLIKVGLVASGQVSRTWNRSLPPLSTFVTIWSSPLRAGLSGALPVSLPGLARREERPGCVGRSGCPAPAPVSRARRARQPANLCLPVRGCASEPRGGRERRDARRSPVREAGARPGIPGA